MSSTSLRALDAARRRSTRLLELVGKPDGGADDPGKVEHDDCQVEGLMLVIVR